MKSLGAALVVLVGIAASAAAQIPVPTPPPVDTFPLTVEPQTVPPLRLGPPEPVSGPTYENLPVPQLPIPDIRVPTSFGALYNAPYTTMGSIDPAALRRGGAIGSDSCCNSGLVCQPAGQFWGEIDYILWKTSGDNVPALITTSPAGTAAAQAGVLRTPGTRTLSGGSSFSDNDRSGLRYNVGVWLNPGQSFGLQTGGFFLEDGSAHSAFASGGDPILARPFTNAVTKTPSSQLIAFPGTLGGGVAVDHYNSVTGFDAALRGNMCCAPAWRLDALFGYRYLRIEDGLAINENVVAGPAAPGSLGVPAGTNVLVADRFHTSNTFNGLQVGIAGEYRFAERWFLSGTGKASLGWIDQVTDIAGATTILVPGQAASQNVGGLLALGSNIGHREQSNAVLIPELNLNLGYQLSTNLRVRAGYSLLYVSSVARPGTIIDTTVNPALIPPPGGTPTPARPSSQPDRIDFFLYGFNAGLELRF